MIGLGKIKEYRILPGGEPEVGTFDAIILVVVAQEFHELEATTIRSWSKSENLLYDQKSVLPDDEVDL